tara:strand:- start:372 stop:965 length:594 start_codon:yes stop_codon:yes gene_type:complete
MGGFSGGANAGGGGNRSGGNPNFTGSNANKGIVGGGSVSNNRTRGSASGRALRDVGNFFATGGITGAVIRGVTGAIKSANKKSKQNVMDYEGQAAGVTPMRSPNITTGGNDGNGGGVIEEIPKGIELAKASTTSATILGPEQIQKEAANNILGPTTTEMSADEIVLANKRRGRRTTNITAKKTLDKNYTLSKKTLLG